MKISSFQPPVLSTPAAARAAAAPAAAEEAPAGETFTKSEPCEGASLASVGKGAAYGLGISAAVGLGLTVATCGAMLPVAIIAVPICGVLGAYVGAVNPKFES